MAGSLFARMTRYLYSPRACSFEPMYRMSSIEVVVFEIKMSSERASSESPISKRASARSNFLTPVYPSLSAPSLRGDTEGVRVELKGGGGGLFSGVPVSPWDSIVSLVPNCSIGSFRLRKDMAL